jgi:hypothetical protein
MKKHLFILSILLAGAFKSNAQSIQLLDTTGAHGGSGSAAQSSYTLTVDTSASGDFMFNVKNPSSSVVTLKVKKYLISNTGSDIITFCVGTNCYPDIATTSSAFSIPANSLLSNGFLADFTATNTPNTAKVMYTIYNTTTTSDSISVTINYNVVNNAAAGIQQVTGINNHITVYPNPASSDVSFSYDLGNVSQQATVKIYNMLGSLVKTVPLETYANNTKVDINSLDEGVYIYSVIFGGKTIKTSRLVVSR